MTVVNIGPFAEHAIPAALQVTFTDADGTALNLTSAGATTIKFVHWPVGGATADAVERTGTVVDGSAGIVKYTWVEADMVVGSYRGRMWAYATDQSAIYASDLYAWVVVGDPAVPAALTA